MKKKDDFAGKFYDLCIEKFAFLIDEFGCQVMSRKYEDNAYTIIFQNKTTAIAVTYDQRETRIFILLMRLVAGMRPAYPVFGVSEDLFYLDDLLSIRSPTLSFEPVSSWTDIEDRITAYARALHQFAVDVLTGNFDIFSELKRIVENRVV